MVSTYEVIVYRVELTSAADYAVYKMQFTTDNIKGNGLAAKQAASWVKVGRWLVEDMARAYAAKQLEQLCKAGFRAASHGQEYAAVRELTPAVQAYGTKLLPLKRKPHKRSL